MRVGLTGGLGSGKTTVAGMLRAYGIPVLEADAMARELMQPGQAVYQGIVDHFGAAVVRPDGTLDRPRLAAFAFREGCLNELNRIVHPPVIAEQEKRMQPLLERDAHAIVVVESALIFEAEAWGSVPGWRQRFDRVVLVTAPDDLKIERFLARVLPEGASAAERAEAERDARARLAAQLPDAEKIPRSDAVIDNSGSLDATQAQVERLVAGLRTGAGASPAD